MGENNSMGRKSPIWKILTCRSMVLNALLYHEITRVYPLMATSLFKAQCNQIMKPIRAARLPALGINRHLTLEVVHGPKQYQGVGIMDLWTIQGILKFWLALQHGDAPTITGHQLHASMELHTIEIGLPGQLFQQDYKIFGQLATNSWLQHLWDFCYDSNFQLASTTPQLCLARDHDEFPMKAFASHGYQDSQYALLNLCRLSCHALRLSDISTGGGRGILPRSWQGYPTHASGCKFEWPYHGRHQTRLGTYGDWLYGTASLLSRPI
jgi:hypothetical protein